MDGAEVRTTKLIVVKGYTPVVLEWPDVRGVWEKEKRRKLMAWRWSDSAMEVHLAPDKMCGLAAMSSDAEQRKTMSAQGGMKKGS